MKEDINIQCLVAKNFRGSRAMPAAPSFPLSFDITGAPFRGERSPSSAGEMSAFFALYFRVGSK